MSKPDYDPMFDEPVDDTFTLSEDQRYFYTALYKQLYGCMPMSLEFTSQSDFNDAYNQLIYGD